MSKYTTEVRFICETASGETESKGFDDVNRIITAAAPIVFDFDFPIFDENYRLPLEIKILRHYYTREICEETVGLWKLRLQDKLNLIMPYYNKLYESELLEFNPLYDVDITREHELERNGSENSSASGSKTNAENSTASGSSTNTENSTSANSNNRWDLYSDTPQGGIEGITGEGSSVEDNTYLTNARHLTDAGQSSASATGNSSSQQSASVNQSEQATSTENKTITNTDEYVEHVRGKQGSTTYSKMIIEFRKTMLNIDNMVIEELSNLFFGLWA